MPAQRRRKRDIVAREAIRLVSRVTRHMVPQAQRKKVGASPGTLVHVGEKKVEESRLQLIDYAPDHLDERELEVSPECEPYRRTESVTWLNLDGLHDVDKVDGLGQMFGIHPLSLEDILNTGHRPKFEDYGSYLLGVLKMIDWDEEIRGIRTEQISIVIGERFVLSFQERTGDVFEPVRQRIRSGKGRIRRMGPDYLAFALMDAVVDNYLVVLERLGEELEAIEEELERDPSQNTLQRIHRLKREMILVRRAVWPIREGLAMLTRDELPLVAEETRAFFRDLYDHTIHVIDTLETFRDIAGGLQDLYLSLVSNRMNEVMKVLTIIATIFIPLTFIAGIYGMNFDHMPELHWEWGYQTVWLVMGICFLGMYVFFKRKKWL